ncbi:hypothetical protein AB0I51_46665 [Streptomyces sp. NPDC050549]|uniref:three-helix bundle dimerization domain-containing protein n=1 Tax=Streptomyces sp. NPDC050549 TaxID=3155406 RepID=UPI0034404091
MSIDLDEEAAIRRVTEHLNAWCHGSHTLEEIEATVAEARRAFTALPIRTYVPILVERKSRSILGEHPR